jgi:hypothetical protein
MSQTLLTDALESGSTISTGWTETHDCTDPATYSIDSTEEYSGTGCQKVVALAVAVGKYFGQYYDLSLGGLNYQGSTIALTAYAKKAAASSAPSFKLQVLELSSAGATLATHESSSADLTNSWVAQTLSFALSSASTATLRIRLLCYGADEEHDYTVYFDAVTVTSSVVLTGYVESDFVDNLKEQLDAGRVAGTLTKLQEVHAYIPVNDNGPWPALFIQPYSCEPGDATGGSYPTQEFEWEIKARLILVVAQFDKQTQSRENWNTMRQIVNYLLANRGINAYCHDFGVDRIEDGDQAFMRSGGLIASHGVIEVTGKRIQTITHS